MATRPRTPTGERAGAGGLPRRSVTLWAWALAEQHLARSLPRRWAHVQGVARLASRVGRALLIDRERELLVAAALLHDIGYAAPLVDSGYHPLDGARFLTRERAPSRLANLVAQHSGAVFVARLRGLATELAAFPDERTALRDALWHCDMRIDPDGEPITFDARIADIRVRHGAGSYLVRALDSGLLAARHDAVHRTELRLSAAENLLP
jgi:putative nucleotidyltransferase with HDIG domain